MKNNKTLLVITFFNRKHTLSKQLKFLESYSEDLDVILVDQSEDFWSPAPKHNKIKEVHHYPASQFHFYEMWKDICKLYNEYSFIYWNNDDDFASPTGIKVAEKFLIENPEYSCAQGQVIQMLSPNMINWQYGTPEWIKKDKNEEDTLRRIESVFVPSVYVNPHILTRMSVWAKAINIICDSVNSPASLAPIKSRLYFPDKIA